jgi:hypothetical protein
MTKRLVFLIPLILLFIIGCGERNAADIPGPFRLLGEVQTRGWPQDVAVDDTIAAVADDQAGTAIIDIRNAAAPVVLHSYPVTGYNYRVTLCVLSLENGIFAPYNPTTGGPPLYDVATGAFANGGFRNSSEVYKMDLVSKPDTLQLFASDRTPSDGFVGFTLVKSGNAWVEVANLPNYTAGGNRICGFDLFGDLAVLCFDQLGVVIRNWVTSTDVTWVDTPGGARDAVWVGDYIFVADYGNGVQVIDAEPQSEAAIVASIVPPGSSRLERIAAAGGYLFVLDANDGIYVIDISAPASPQYLQLLDTPAPTAVVARDGKIYVADNYRGLLVYGIG